MIKEENKKCTICRRNNIACDYIPLMTSEEAAKLITLKEDVVNKKSLKLYRVGDDCFLLADPKWEANNKLYLEDVVLKTCPFFDKEKGCTVYNTKPQMCRDFGEHPSLKCPFDDIDIKEMEKLNSDDLLSIFLRKQTFNKYFKERFGILNSVLYSSLGYKNILKLPNYSGGKFKKLLKQNKENLLMYNILNFVYGAFEAEKLTEKENIKIADLVKARIRYKLVTEDNRITTVITRHYDTDIAELKPLTRIYNRLMNKFVFFPNDYLIMIYKKSKSIANVLDSKKDCIEPAIFDNNKKLEYAVWMLMSVLLLENWKLNFKNKAKDFQNLYKADEMSIVKDTLVKIVQKELGLEVTGWSFKLLLEDPFKCIANAMVDFYKTIIRAG